MSKVQEKARALRYKKPILAELNYDEINNKLWEIQEECSNVAFNSIEDVIDAFDGDEEEAYEFMFGYHELDAECETLRYALEDSYLQEHFNDFFVGILNGGKGNFNVLGYDSYEEDYYGLCRYETDMAQNEAADRLKRLTKDKLVKTAGQCFGVAMSFYNVMFKYKYIEAALATLREENQAVMEAIKNIEKLYDEERFKELDKAVRYLPERIWLE